MSSSRNPSVVVVDDHLDMARLVAGKLVDDGWRARVADSGRAALAAIAADPPDVVITDLRMPDIDGLAVVDAARHTSAVIVMTAFGEIATAVEAMRRGAWHYVSKPVRLAELVQLARRALAERGGAAVTQIVGTSTAIQEVLAAAVRVARADVPVLVRGETGTGKELVAHAIHAASDRRDGPFVAINCAAMPEGLVESELFGHTRGAFTGATADREGVFGAASGGTLFLDEIGDMPLAIQAKLLRVLQEHEVRAVGADRTHAVDVRVIAGTHQDLEQRVRDGRFRSDLLYRLDVVPIRVPALRERRDDIALLAQHFLARTRARGGATCVERFSDDLLAALRSYGWPGNVRELENVVQRLAILGTASELDAGDLRRLAPHLTGSPPAFETARDELVPLREVEDQYIAWVMQRCDANRTRAAQILGVDPSTLYRRAQSTRTRKDEP